MKKKLSDITFSWEEGRYFDLWMIVHLIGGVALAGFFLLIEVDRGLGYLLALVIGILWEVLEYLYKVREHEQNRVLDVVFELIGYGLMYEAMQEVVLEAYPSIFILSFVMFVLLSFIGWLDYKRRSGEEN